LGVKLDDYCGKKIFNFGIRVVKKYIDRARHLKRKISREIKYTLNPSLKYGGPSGLAKKWIDYQTYQQKGGTWIEVYSEQKYPHKRARTHNWGKDKFNFSRNLKSTIPPTGVFKIPHGQVLHNQGYVLTQDDYFMVDTSYHRQRLVHANLPKEKYPVEFLDGTCLSLMSNASNNYYHFLLDAIPRLHLFEKAGFSLNDVDYILMNQPMSPNAWDIFEQMGIDESKCVWAQKGKGIQAKMLIATTHPSLDRHHPHWMVNFMQTRINLSPCKPHRLLYIPRKTGTRKIINDDQIYGILEKFGFEYYLPENDTNQPQTFHEASIIVTPHGAALGNLVFCQPHTKVLEFISTGHLREYFFSLAHVANLEHHYIIGETIPPTKPRGKSSKNDYFIEPRYLQKALCFLMK